MAQIVKGNGFSRNRAAQSARAYFVTGFLLCAGGGFAQMLPVQSTGVAQTAMQDSIVRIAAKMEALAVVPPGQAPAFGGTFWLVMPGGVGGVSAVPLPCPPVDPSLPIYAITPDGQQFLVDGTSGQLLSTTSQIGRTAASAVTSSLVESQVSAVVNLINQIQVTQVAQQTTMEMGLDLPSLGEGGDYGSSVTTYAWDTNALWLEITNVSNGFAYANLRNATNQVYAIWATTNLLTPFSNWQVVTEVWPADTNCAPFTAPTLNQNMLFLRAQDWMGVELNGLPCWWTWLYFGDLLENATNVDSQGFNTLGYDYLLSLDPNVISFTLSYTNQYANAPGAPMHLAVTAGVPSYFAVLVDDTNHADANWTAYTSSNITVNLGITEGWHQVCVGLRGMPANAYQSWQTTRFKLDLSPPLLVITTPTPGTVTRPVIQLQGYSPEALASISYDLTNATGLITNQQTLILGHYYDTNTLELATNYFQCFDVPLTNGLNTIVLHATDLAGNVATSNFNFALDYSGDTPPTIQIAWPQAGTKISGSSFTAHGQISDPTAQVSVQIVDTNGVTNSINGRVGRDGDFWVDDVPLSGGVNNLSLMATDAAGNTSMTTIPVVQSSLVLTITSAGLGQAVTGTISDTNYTIWVNGVMATNNMDGTWIAQDPHLTLATPAVQVRAIPNSDNRGYGGGQ